MAQEGPLTQDHLKEIKNNLDTLDTVEREIERAGRAGVDLSAEKKRVTEMRLQLRRIGTTYFPGKM